MKDNFKEFKLASHNSFSYLKPAKWWMKLINFTAKCQDKTIEEQYESGVRMFDFRVFFKDGKAGIRHGLVEYLSYEEAIEKIDWLNHKSHNDIYIRVLLEYNSEPKNCNIIKDLFIRWCSAMEQKYSNLKFYEGRAKWNWGVLYRFKNSLPSMTENYSSVVYGNSILGILPRVYAKSNNEEILSEGTSSEFLMIDFV